MAFNWRMLFVLVEYQQRKNSSTKLFAWQALTIPRNVRAKYLQYQSNSQSWQNIDLATEGY
jgi:hypothetical protein